MAASYLYNTPFSNLKKRRDYFRLLQISKGGCIGSGRRDKESVIGPLTIVYVADLATKRGDST